MHDRRRSARVARRAGLVRNRRRVVHARRAHAQAVDALSGTCGARHLALAGATGGFTLGAQALAFGFLRLAVRFALGFAAGALFFLRLARGFLLGLALGGDAALFGLFLGL